METETSYVVPLGPDSRKRHHHFRERGRVTRFLVQVEIKIGNYWYPVVRFDTAHGFAHKDLLHPDGSAEKVVLGVVNYGEALDLAEEDIESNWQRYVERYCEEVQSGRKRDL